MPEIEFKIRSQGKVLQEYFDSKADVQLIRGPFGSGKTVQSCMKMLDVMCKQEPTYSNERKTRWLAVRNTYSELFTTTIKDWIECHGELGVFKQGGNKPPTHTLDFFLEDGTRVLSEVIFIAFDRPDHVTKARGMQVTGVWLNEVKELAKPVVDILDLRHGRYPSAKEGAFPTWHGMIGDYNSPDEDHWLYRLSEEVKPEGWEFFVQPGGVLKDDAGEWAVNENAENINNLPKDYYLRGMRAKSDAWILVNLANEYGFLATGAPVHPRYIDSVHCKDMLFVPTKNEDIILGFDFGRTPACAFLQKTAVGGWICFDEFLSENMSALTFAPELGKYLSRMYPGHTFKGWGDPAGNDKGQSTDDTPIRILNAAGIPCQPTATNKAAIRRASVELPLRDIGMDGNPRLIILPMAKTIRKGLAGGFCYKRIEISGEERYRDEPDKNSYSHPVEALEYGLQGEGEGREVLASSKGKYDNWDTPVNF